MILRRISDAFRKQDWFTVGVETLIVVLGVFLGLQVNNWNGVRSDRARETVYLASLAEDLRSDIADLDEIDRVSGLRMSAMSYLLERATGAPLPDGFESARGRIRIETSPPYTEDDPSSIGIAMFIFTPLDGNRLTYDTLVNTGGIGIFRDTALVREIQTYYANVDKVLHFEESLEANRAQFVGAQQAAGYSPVDVATPDALAEQFSKAPELLAGAKNYWLYTNRHLKLVRDLRAEAGVLAAKIDRSHPE